MKYGFLPSSTTSLNLSTRFKQQLRESYVEMLEQLHDYDSTRFSSELASSYSIIEVDKFNGFHCFAYHRVIALAEAGDFDAVEHALRSGIDRKYDDLPKFVRADAVDDSLVSTILDQIILGTTHKGIRLLPLQASNEIDVASELSKGIEFLKMAYPELAIEISNLVRSVLFFDSAGETDERALSFTGDKLTSLILINGTIEPSWIFLLDKYIHEAAHTYLYAINLHEALVLNTEGSEYSSPLRKDARDMHGIFHATFVIQRLIVAFTRILQLSSISRFERLQISSLLAYYHERVLDGYQTVVRHGQLSEIASIIINEGDAQVAELRHVATS